MEIRISEEAVLEMYRTMMEWKDSEDNDLVMETKVLPGMEIQIDFINGEVVVFGDYMLNLSDN